MRETVVAVLKYLYMLLLYYIVYVFAIDKHKRNGDAAYPTIEIMGLRRAVLYQIKARSPRHLIVEGLSSASKRSLFLILHEFFCTFLVLANIRSMRLLERMYSAVNDRSNEFIFQVMERRNREV